MAVPSVKAYKGMNLDIPPFRERAGVEVSQEEAVTSVFSKAFTPSVLDGARFLSRTERSCYKDSREKIQKAFIDEKRTEFTLEVARCGRESLDTYGLTLESLHRLIRNVNCCGFDVKLFRKGASTETAPRTHKITVTFPETERERYFRLRSPSWRSSFKASSIKERNAADAIKIASDFSFSRRASIPVLRQEIAEEELTRKSYEQTAKTIESSMLSNRDVAFHGFMVDRDCPDSRKIEVAEKIVEDLRNRGFNASLEGRERDPFFGPSIKISK